MKRANLSVVSLLALSAGGCATVVSSNPGTTSATGDAWYTTTVGFAYMAFSTHVYYCPKPAGPGPVQCKEAKYIEAGK